MSSCTRMLVRSLLLAREGDREQASAIVASLAATSQDTEESRVLHRLATALARSPGRGSAHSGFAGASNASSGLRATAGIILSIAPNPIRDRATIDLRLEAASDVRIALHDVLGREAMLLSQGSLAAGRHVLSFGVSNLAPGAYLVRTQAEGGRVSTSRRVTVVR